MSLALMAPLMAARGSVNVHTLKKAILSGLFFSIMNFDTSWSFIFPKGAKALLPRHTRGGKEEPGGRSTRISLEVMSSFSRKARVLASGFHNAACQPIFAMRLVTFMGLMISF